MVPANKHPQHRSDTGDERQRDKHLGCTETEHLQ
jgi:hypothetical protein